MATEKQVQKVLNSLSEYAGCRKCGCRIRFGDIDCPRCGADLEDDLWAWATKLVDELDV